MIMKYDEIKNNEHVFVYAVCGRSSSTALQRILNSSNEVCIYGEPHYVVDKLLNALHYIEEMSQGKIDNIYKPQIKSQSLLFSESFKFNKHNEPYPNAIGNWDYSISLLYNSFIHMFQPLNDIKRFGFKEIRLQNSVVLNMLKKMFRNAYFVFLFKDPLFQWNSIKNAKQEKFWSYASDVKLFVDEYVRLSNLYINFQNDRTFWIENTLLYKEENVSKFLEKINIHNFDREIINDRKRNINKKSLENENLYIRKSEAFNNYLKMKKKISL